MSLVNFKKTADSQSHGTNLSEGSSATFSSSGLEHLSFTRQELTSNIVEIPRSTPARSLPDNSSGIIAKFPSKLRGIAAALVASAGTISPVAAGVMRASNYDNPEIRQQHFNTGLAFHNQVVYITVNGEFCGSGVVVNNANCILLTGHQVEEDGQFYDPQKDEIIAYTGSNYLTNKGVGIKATKIIRHPTRTSPQVGTDLALIITDEALPGVTPVTIASTAPAVGDIVTLVGFGAQWKCSISNWQSLPITGDIIGGNAPVNTIDSSSIKTRFTANSNIPLIFNGTPGHSGGGCFNSQKQLCGIMILASSPGSSANTYSTNLIVPENYNWIQSTSAANQLIIKPNLSINVSNGHINLSVDCPIIQATGSWILQHSTDLVEWQNCPQQFEGTSCSMPVTDSHGYFRMSWEASQ